MNNQENIKKSSLYSKLKEYGESDYYPYHMPGHKRNSVGEFGQDFLRMDITEIEGFDNLHNPEGIIKNIQEKIAKACGVSKSYMLVNGSTCGVLAAISASVSKNGKLLIVRNAHKSAYNAMILRDICPVYVYPEIDEKARICEAVTADQIKKELDKDSDHIIKAVFIVSPTYEGKIANIDAISKIVHEHGAVLIVDEAHGAHLPFAKSITGYGKSACQSGADIIIQSCHKTLPAPTQTAVLHINSDRIKAKDIDKYLHIFETSSPSYPLMAGIELAYDQMLQNGTELLKNLRDRFIKLICEIANSCKIIKAMPIDDSHDVGKLVIYTEKKEITGKYIADKLRDKYHLETELSGERYLLAMFTVCDTQEGFDRLGRALIEIDKELRRDTNLTDINKSENIYKSINNRAAVSISEAFCKGGVSVELDNAGDAVSADFVMLYPPGVPILVPGEIITKEHIALIKDYLDKKLQVIGLENEKIEIL